jgi:adenylate cyclase
VIFSFGDCELDTSLYGLRRQGKACKIEPKAFDLLLYLVKNRGRVVTKDEIYERIWKGRIVSEATLSSCINAARQAIGDSGKSQMYIRTYSRRGFRFIADVDVLLLQDERASHTPAPRSKEAPRFPERPSIAVLPFTNMSGDPEQEYFSDGITEDIITSLSKFKDLFVIARESSFAFKDMATPPVEKVVALLGVRYLVMGSIRRTHDRVRFTVRLVDASRDHVIWAESFDRSYEYIFELQDDITEVIVSAIAMQVESAEIERMRESLPANLDAYGLVLQAQQKLHYWAKVQNLEARDLFDQALEADSRYARAMAGASRTYNLDWRYSWAESPETSLEKALELARTSVTLDEYDYRGYAELGFVNLYRKRHEASLKYYERSLRLNPNDANVMAEMADALTNSGRPEEAIRLIEKAMRLNPFYPDYYLWYLGGAYFDLRRYEDVIESVGQMHNPTEGRRLLAASYAHLGRIEEARRQASLVLQAHPNFSLEHWQRILPDKQSENVTHLIKGLKKAGL